MRHGFTILELVVVLALLAVLSSFAIPSYFGRPEITLDNAARLLAQDLRDVQNRAALYQEDLFFHVDEGGYEITSRDGTPILSPYGTHPYVRRYDRDAVFRGVEIVSADLGGLEAIEYTGQGTARQGARLVIEYGGEQRVVRIRPFTGLIEIDGLARPWNDDGN